MFAFAFSSPLSMSPNYQPNYQGCTTELAKSMPYCDTKLSVDERVAWLVGNLTLDEKIQMISPQQDLGGTCGTHTRGKASIGLPNYFWLTEANSGIAATCHTTPYRCPTTFIGPLGFGASFNRSSWRLKGGVLGREMRAFNNIGWHRHASGDLVGLTGFGPNINIARDPRFGRTSELPGEDPFLNGHYAAQMVQGMQERNEAGHPLMLTYLKHFTAYSTETDRGHDDYKISPRDFWESYLPQYELAFKQGNASGVMCSYDAENGHPSCANGWLLNEVIRAKWGQEHALVTTDCGAVSNMRGPPTNTPTDVQAAAWTLMNGTDIEMGSTVWSDNLHAAVSAGLATEAAVTRAVSRSMRQLFVAGRFDPPSAVGWSSLGLADINTTHAQRVSYEAALQGMVLLKNDGLLPLRRGAAIAVVGPMGVNTDLMSDYAGGTGEEGCWPDSGEGCVRTIAQAIAQANGGNVTVAKGCDVNSPSPSGIEAALAAARAAEAVVLALGNDRSVEHEGVDRKDIGLLGQQRALATQVLALGKPTVLVLSNGGALGIDGLVDGPRAIVEAFNPAQQTAALAALLFGDENRWGKLPYTVYPSSYTDEQPMTNYDMSSGPGRTYKYYPSAAAKTKPLFEFGAGLSLTTFSLGCALEGKSDAPSGATYAVRCSVANTGKRAGDEVVLVFHAAGESVRKAVHHPVPRKALVDFARVTVSAGDTATVTFRIDEQALALVDAAGERVIVKGEHSLLFEHGDGRRPSEIKLVI